MRQKVATIILEKRIIFSDEKSHKLQGLEKVRIRVFCQVSSEGSCSYSELRLTNYAPCLTHPVVLLNIKFNSDMPRRQQQRLNEMFGMRVFFEL